jgi:hypothetical protein
MQSPCYLYFCLSPINFLKAEPIFIQLGMYIVAPEPISTAHFINPSHQSVCLYVYLPTVAWQRLDKIFSASMNKQATLKELLNTSFCARSMQYEGKYGISSSQNFFLYSCCLCNCPPFVKLNILSRVLVIINGVRIGNWIYCSLISRNYN